MRTIWQPAIYLAALSVCLLVTANAQQNGSSSGRGGSSRVTGRTAPNPPTNPTLMVYYTGKVVIDSGIQPPGPVAILRVCNGFRRRETYTASDGSFSFVASDRNTDILPDASDDTRAFGQYNSQSANANPAGLGQSNFQSPIADCELRADLAGYLSSSIHLDQSMTNSNVGVIVLHSRNKKAEGGMVTVASLEVPAKARHTYEKGSEALEQGDLEQADKELHKAIDEYPRFAEAWLRLGDLEQRRKNIEAAANDYRQAADADLNFALPYLRMAFLSAVARNWEQTRQLTEKLIALDPVSFPLGYYYNAVAEFNLHDLAKAETNALRAEAMDKQHAEPRVELLLASIYNAKSAYSSAADHYRVYLKLVPNGPLTDRVKTDLVKTEELAKSQAPGAPATTTIK